MSVEGPVLAIDTATRQLSVALVSAEGCVAELHDDDDRIHSERLLPAVDHVLAEAKLELSELAGIALSIGPGSFTGLRIGLATVKGLCFGAAIPVATVSTLAALALAVDGEGPGAPCSTRAAGRPTPAGQRALWRVRW